jgi:dTMP kinase
MYLEGKLGKNANDTDAYAASVLFAVDRFASFRADWKEIYDRDDYVILLNRYTTANAVHQLSKIDNEAEKEKFLSWLFDFEYGLLKIPSPNLVIYLEMPTEISLSLLEKRCDDTGALKDIHEEDKNHLTKSRNAAIYACEKLGWHRVSCAKDSSPRTREDIHEEIFGIFCECAPKDLIK